jgi:hypothetical protein
MRGIDRDRRAIARPRWRGALVRTLSSRNLAEPQQDADATFLSCHVRPRLGAPSDAIPMAQRWAMERVGNFHRGGGVGGPRSRSVHHRDFSA